MLYCDLRIIFFPSPRREIAMKVTKNEKTLASISTGKLDKSKNREKASDSSTFVARGMVFVYKGVLHLWHIKRFFVGVWC